MADSCAFSFVSSLFLGLAPTRRVARSQHLGLRRRTRTLQMDRLGVGLSFQTGLVMTSRHVFLHALPSQWRVCLRCLVSSPFLCYFLPFAWSSYLRLYPGLFRIFFSDCSSASNLDRRDFVLFGFPIIFLPFAASICMKSSSWESDRRSVRPSSSGSRCRLARWLSDLHGLCVFGCRPLWSVWVFYTCCRFGSLILGSDLFWGFYSPSSRAFVPLLSLCWLRVQLGLARSGKSCRLRWINYLKPGVKRGKFSKEEEDSVLKWHEGLGNRKVVCFFISNVAMGNKLGRNTRFLYLNGLQLLQSFPEEWTMKSKTTGAHTWKGDVQTTRPRQLCRIR